ncbi:unnamed protein product [Arabidopsis thaliana]|uniref:CLASP N-terminal domain-containing protein n=1 Tax=Arabidopsis thaliana TaxID=3702 RepID=A0A654FAB4_ARATH|nr:unnamed protein product [Arabidopsis thaliana]
MAAKALKDLKNLPVSERNIDCKKNPCAGKMNGKAEDRPPQNSVPLDHNHPTGDEIEKPEAERVIVELEYIKSKDLNNVAEVDAVLKVSIVLSWYYTMLYCDFSFSLDRSSSFHFPQGRNAAFAKVILFVVKSLKNPRSAVSKTACMTSEDIFSSYNDHIFDQLDRLLTQLLLKSSQDKRFVYEAAERALVAMTTHVSPALLLPKLRPCLKNKSPRIRAKASACFSGCVPRLGIEGMREYGIETNSQNLRRLHGQSSWNLRQCIRKLLLSNPRRRIQRQPLGQSSANQTSHLLVHRLCFVSPMSLVRLERVLLRVHDTSPHYVPCSLYKLSRDQYFYTYWVVILFTPKNKYGMFFVPRQKVY